MNVLTVFTLLAASLLFGFYLGRTVFGGQNLGRSSQLRPAAARYVPRDTSADYRYQLNELPPDPNAGPLATPRIATPGALRREAGASRQPRREAAAEAPPRARRYTVQVGVFLKEENSQELLDDLRNRGYRGRVTTSSQDGQQVHKVQMGSYRTQQEAEQAAKALREQGYQVRVAGE